MDTGFHREQLIHILQRAYSGECAAGYAYRGHWKSVKKPTERWRIQQIEREEWIHREGVGRMLNHLGAHPLKRLEAKLWLIGHVIGMACHFIGWFMPMYFAGRLEHGNVDEYVRAAFHAAELGLSEFAAELQRMAEVERQHELFFLSVIKGHCLLPLMQAVFKWGLDAESALPEPLSGVSSAVDDKRPII
jgi:demethoxyubiquinone hydroxylase (CLK1/Coq7/Cat5 family)